MVKSKEESECDQAILKGCQCKNRCVTYELNGWTKNSYCGQRNTEGKRYKNPFCNCDSKPCPVWVHCFRSNRNERQFCFSGPTRKKIDLSALKV